MHIERKIIIGLISSTDFFAKVRAHISAHLFAATYSRLIAGWCIQYYDTYNKAPGVDIADIYYKALQEKKIDEETANEIENEILPELSEDAQLINDIDALVDHTITYMNTRQLIMLQNNLEVLLEKGDITGAQELISKFNKIDKEEKDELTLNELSSSEPIHKAFEQVSEPLVKFPGALGKFWNHSYTRGSFVAFLAPEKRGKTMLLMEIMFQAAQQGKKVAFIQAGDMTTSQMLQRIAVYLTRKTLNENSVGELFVPVKDCINNQLNICDKPIRECDFGIFEARGWSTSELRRELTFEHLQRALEEEPDYKPCHNCSDWHTKKIGSVFLTRQKIKLITPKQAANAIMKWFIVGNKQVKIRTFVNNTLSIRKLTSVLEEWKRIEWIPDVLLIDYADLMLPDIKGEFRHQQNQIWKDLRRINQELNCCLVTATQADAKSYDKDTLSLSNYSEDKRKYAHATAFYGLNWDKDGREKKMGLLRINELILRDSAFDEVNQVYLIQHKHFYRPLVGSFF